MSLWAPQHGDFDDWVKPSKQMFCVGHYGHAGSYTEPVTTRCFRACGHLCIHPFVRGDYLDPALEQFAPHPRQFRRAWQVHLPDPDPHSSHGNPFLRPTPVALGMVMTKTDDHRARLRCAALSLLADPLVPSPPSFGTIVASHVALRVRCGWSIICSACGHQLANGRVAAPLVVPSGSLRTGRSASMKLFGS